jgi:hypothetical protein
MPRLATNLATRLATDLSTSFSPYVKARFADASFTNASARYLSYAQLTESFAGGTLATRRINGKIYAQIESAAENLIVYCDKYDEAAWTNNELTLADAAVTTPHADLDGWTLTPTAVDDRHYISQAENGDGSSQYCWSAILKANGYNFGFLRMSSGAIVGEPFAYFNLGTGAVGNSGGVDTVGMEDKGNGYYLCYISALCNNASDLIPIALVSDADYNLYTPTTFEGDTTSGIICCHTQLEIGHYPSSIVETAAAAVTRAKDQLLWSSANVPNALRGRISVDIIPYWPYNQTPVPNVYIMDFAASGASNRIAMYYGSGDDKFYVRNVTTATNLVSSNAVTFGRLQRLSLIYTPTSGKIEVARATTGNGPVTGSTWSTTAGNVHVGQTTGGAAHFNGLISEPY